MDALHTESALVAQAGRAPDLNERTPAELAAIVRAELKKCRAATANALAAAMGAGDALIAVRPKVDALGISWTKWLRENCFVAESTARLYVQLAEHRSEIEAEIDRGVELSIRAARRLISKDTGADNGAGGDDAGDGADNAGVRGKPLGERQLEEFLRQYFARTTGAEIFEHIPPARRAEIVRDFVDRLGDDAKLIDANVIEQDQEPTATSLVAVNRVARKPKTAAELVDRVIFLIEQCLIGIGDELRELGGPESEVDRFFATLDAIVAGARAEADGVDAEREGDAEREDEGDGIFDVEGGM